MRAYLQFLIPFLVAATVGAGCSLLVNFDPEGQPCDAEGQCLAGYGCVDNKCVKGADAGTSVCGNCAAGFKCLEASRSCVPNTCQYTRCVVGSICTEDTGVPTCRPVQSPALGHACVDDVDCFTNGANRFCFKSAIPAEGTSGASRTGVCVEKCPASGPCINNGATCKAFPLGLDAGVTNLCVPDNLLSSCRTDFDCIDPAFVCTVYDNANLGPATICDQPLATGTSSFNACTSSKADGGTLPYCANGLCLPQNVSEAVPQKCGSPCNEGTCSTSQTCQSVEINITGTPRFIPMCVTSASTCTTCTDDTGCNPDAPHCTFNAGKNVCLARCALDAGQGTQCANGATCQAVDAGVLRCVPQAGCP